MLVENSIKKQVPGEDRTILGQHRIIPVRRLRRPIFRQAAQKAQGILRVLPSIFVLYDGILGKQDVCRELCGVALELAEYPDDRDYDAAFRLLFRWCQSAFIRVDLSAAQPLGAL